MQHAPVYTLGKRGKGEDVLASSEKLLRLGAEVHHSPRGGEATFQGPGQVRLQSRTVKLDRYPDITSRTVRGWTVTLISPKSCFPHAWHIQISEGDLPHYPPAWCIDQIKGT